MKVLLIHPPVREWAKPNCFPLGLGYISAVLLKEGHEVEVLDINGHRYTKEDVEERIKNCPYEIVGIGGIVTTYKYVKWLIGVLRKYHSEQKIVIGGSLGSSIPDIILKNNSVDIICMGEGEETAKELVATVEQGGDLSSVKGIWFREKDGSVKRNQSRTPINNLDSLAFPAWHLFPMDVYLKNPIGALNVDKWVDGSCSKGTFLSMNLYASRGCPYQCVYCYHDFMGQGYRQRSPEHVLDEMRTLYQRYKVKYFHFIDDEFMLRRKFVYEFCDLVNDLRREFSEDITWGCTGRVNLVTERLVSTMAGSGCIQICYGIESGSQKMLDFIKKQVTVEQAKKAIKVTKKYLGWADCSFMIGYPGETKETIQETIDFCKELNLIPEVVFFLTPYPGTALYKMALDQGWIEDEEDYMLNLGEQGERISVNFTDWSDEKLTRIKEHMVRKLSAWDRIVHK